MWKTPRTHIENYLDASKTQSVQGARNTSVRLVRTPPDVSSIERQKLAHKRVSRTPEPFMRSVSKSPARHGGLQSRESMTPEPSMQSVSKSRPRHDRVSNLRSKIRAFSNSDAEETPRQLLEGFLEDEDTTAPLVRYASRTSQERLSNSQPALRVSRRSSQSQRGNWSVDLDSDTPRTLLQKYVRNTTDVIDTPAARGGQQLEHSPDVPIPQDTYHTPSPFKASSAGSEWHSSVTSAIEKMPRSLMKKRGKFSIGVTDTFNQTLDENIIPPTNPTDYHVPIAFQSSSSDEERFIPETQSSEHFYNRTHRGQFNISVPKEMREEISRYQQSQMQQKENIFGARNLDGTSENDTVSDSELEMEHDDQPGTRMLLMDGNGYEEYTLPLKDSQPRSPVISYKEGYINDEEYDYITESERNQVTERRGRWSEGHRSRLGSPDKTDRRSNRLSEGNRRSNEGQVPISQFFLPRQQNLSQKGEMNVSQKQLDENSISAPDARLYERSGHRTLISSNQHQISISAGEYDDSIDALSPDRRYSNSRIIDAVLPGRRHSNSQIIDAVSPGRRHSNSQITDALSPGRRHSYNADIDELYYAQKLNHYQRDHLHTLPNTSSNFSPRITSTQQNITIAMAVDDVEEHLPTVTPSLVVSLSSSPRIYTPTGSPRKSRSRVMTPVPGDSPVKSLTGSSRSATSQSSSRKLKVLTPSQVENQSLMESPSSSSSRRLRMLTPVQTMTSSRSNSRGLTPRNSRVSSPLEALTPSPVVSSMASSLMEYSGSLARKPSSRSSRTPPTSMTTSSEHRNSRQPRSERSNSSRNRSRSDVTTASKSAAASPVLAGRRLAPEMVTTLPNSTVNFSPQIASTQNMAAMSHVGMDQGSRGEQGQGDEDSIDEDNLEQLSDEMEGEYRNETNERQTVTGTTAVQQNAHATTMQQNSQTTAVQQNSQTPAKAKKQPRKPRQKANYSLPVSIVKKQFVHYAGLRVSKEAVEEVMKVSEKYWDHLASDLEAYAKHANRKKINMADFVLLFKRQGHVTEKQSLKSLIEKYLPMEERERLIPVARAGNRIEPKL